MIEIEMISTERGIAFRISKVFEGPFPGSCTCPPGMALMSRETVQDHLDKCYKQFVKDDMECDWVEWERQRAHGKYKAQSRRKKK